MKLVKGDTAVITTVLTVEGMMCEHCARAVTNAVGALPGVEAVEVDLAAKTATVRHDPAQVAAEQIRAAIEGQGYEAV